MDAGGSRTQRQVTAPTQRRPRPPRRLDQEGAQPGVIYVCSKQHLADRVHRAGIRTGLSIEHGALRIELRETINHETFEARARRRGHRLGPKRAADGPPDAN